MPNSIELKVKFLEENKDFDIVRTNGYYVNEENLDDCTKLFITNEIEKTKINIFNDLIEAKTNNWAGSYMVRTSKLFDFYKDKNIYETRYGQNLQILIPLAYKGKSGFIDKPLMKYIKQPLSLSQLNGDINKEIQNLLGYKDIREYMVKILLSGDEQKKYLNLIEETYERTFMNLAFYYNDQKLMKDSFKRLKSYEKDTIEDRILYYNTKNKAIGFFYRSLRKLFRGKIR